MIDCTKGVQYLNEIKDSVVAGFQWASKEIERLDLINAPAPLAPELALKEDLHGKERATQLKQDKAGFSLDEDVVHNDFKREMMFYRQAQAAVMEAIPRLHSMNIRTKR